MNVGCHGSSVLQNKKVELWPGRFNFIQPKSDFSYPRVELERILSADHDHGPHLAYEEVTTVRRNLATQVRILPSTECSKNAFMEMCEFLTLKMLPFGSGIDQNKKLSSKVCFTFSMGKNNFLPKCLFLLKNDF